VRVLLDENRPRDLGRRKSLPEWIFPVRASSRRSVLNLDMPFLSTLTNQARIPMFFAS